MENLGILCLLPPLFIIVFAVCTKRTLPALILGVVLTYVIMHGTGFFGPFVDTMYSVLMSGDTVWVIMLTGLIGVFIALVTKSGGVDALTVYILKLATNQRRTLLSTWLLGLAFFIGDVSNVGTVGATMKDVCDKHKIPRESLAYVLDSTAAPVCVLVPISSWGVFYAGIFMAEESLGFTGNPIDMYLQVMPFMFYSIVAILVVFLFSAGLLPKIGPMKKAYQRVEETGMVYSEASAPLNKEEEEKAGKTQKIKSWKVIHFLIPLAILVYFAINGSFLEGCMISIAAAAILYIPTKSMSFADFCKTSMKGFSNMLSPIFIIVGAFMVREALVAMGLPEYVSTLVEPLLNAGIYPMIVFITVAILSFTTGSNWGVPAVMVPILVPVALSIGANPYIVLAAIASGGAFGSHACFYSDATAFTSAVTKIDNMEHALTQLPYALISAGGAAVLFLVTGFMF